MIDYPERKRVKLNVEVAEECGGREYGTLIGFITNSIYAGGVIEFDDGSFEIVAIECFQVIPSQRTGREG